MAFDKAEFERKYEKRLKKAHRGGQLRAVSLKLTKELLAGHADWREDVYPLMGFGLVTIDAEDEDDKAAGADLLEGFYEAHGEGDVKKGIQNVGRLLLAGSVDPVVQLQAAMPVRYLVQAGRLTEEEGEELLPELAPTIHTPQNKGCLLFLGPILSLFGL
jgi:hypothetical protein